MNGRVTHDSEEKRSFTLNLNNPLNYNTTYTIEIKDVKDQAGNAMINVFKSTFTTEEKQDNMPPTIKGYNPKGKKEKTDILIKVTFSESILSESIEKRGAFSVKDKDGNPVPGSRTTGRRANRR